ncbi:MAG: cyclic 2,3-diphosphoglycerate synthase [Candidatus Oleimicrobiaceae bacterium]
MVMQGKKRVIIMGAAGRDFHNFNMYFRDCEDYEVVAFTATQIPDIEGRFYPPELAGPLYMRGIPIFPESDLARLIIDKKVDLVVFSYSDVSHEYVMHKAAIVNAAGADFCLLGARATMLQSKVPVVAICAVRTGCGKSQTTRRVADILRRMGKRVVIVRHPMPYGDLRKQRVQRFATYDDLDRHECTIEEREEYEPHLDRGTVVYAGVDYAAILAEAEKEAEVILWDGGNNDIPFFRPQLHITVVDPLRAGHEVTYYPGETNLRMADVVVINKETTAAFEDIESVRANIMDVNPRAIVVDAASPIALDKPELVRGRRVLVVEDGPTLTHGEMSYGAGVVAAQKYGARELVDPRPFLKGSLVATFDKYPDIGTLLPAMGYGQRQIKDLQATINACDCDTVIIGTPIDLRRVVRIKHPAVRVRYELQEIGSPTLEEIIAQVPALRGSH